MRRNLKYTVYSTYFHYHWFFYIIADGCTNPLKQKNLFYFQSIVSSEVVDRWLNMEMRASFVIEIVLETIICDIYPEKVIIRTVHHKITLE